ncbi:MAG: hypothetical protein A3B11_00985 [Candidatus Taylorbacteria bacterium RIFCSPLOWO2_01_FULL_44_26]|uniref:Uncharacterized protein n=1 Tax=Candidatus Taylorbacteria bacterium RIFCSPLOWO2_01_FULL_44_26 TaxID=1802318 RepID=A0A1G2N803_9BACT|nr:MAG: hypothetical protein A3B11_00985 [Candidatus Taylorbacteria bacterium RIFCSPLOWO2_01_FULL_44_26]
MGDDGRREGKKKEGKKTSGWAVALPRPMEHEPSGGDEKEEHRQLRSVDHGRRINAGMENKRPAKIPLAIHIRAPISFIGSIVNSLIDVEGQERQSRQVLRQRRMFWVEQQGALFDIRIAGADMRYFIHDRRVVPYARHRDDHNGGDNTDCGG